MGLRSMNVAGDASAVATLAPARVSVHFLVRRPMPGIRYTKESFLTSRHVRSMSAGLGSGRMPNGALYHMKLQQHWGGFSHLQVGIFPCSVYDYCSSNLKVHELGEERPNANVCAQVIL